MVTNDRLLAKQEKSGQKLITRNQLAALCGVSPSTIDNWRKWYEIPEIKLGGRTVRFIEEDVRAFLANREA